MAMHDLGRDLRHAVRALLRSPGYTLLCVTALACGIGVNGAIFALAERLMLRPPPYRNPEQLVLLRLATTRGGGGAGDSLPWSFAKYETARAQQRAFSGIAAFAAESANLTGADEPERVRTEMVTADYLQLLGARLVGGRGLSEADVRPGAAPVALLGEGLWRRRFGGRTDLVGRPIHINGVATTVVGIVGGEFQGLSSEAQVWLPLTAADTLLFPHALDNDGIQFLDVVARTGPHLAPAALRAEARRLGLAIRRGHEAPPPFIGGGDWDTVAQPLAEARRDPFVHRALAVLLAAVAAVLIIACVNLAGLATVRAARRARDMRVRLVMGASRQRLLRQPLLESAILALLGGAAGVAVAAVLVRGLAAMRPEAIGGWGIASRGLQDLAAARVEGSAVWFCVALGAVAAVLSGLLPGIAAVRRAADESLRERGGAVGGWRGRSAAAGSRRLAVSAQMAAATVLLVGAGLLVRSLWALQHVDFGFRPEGVLTFAIHPTETPDGGTAANVVLHRAIVEQLLRLPGVTAAAVGTCPPASGDCNSTGVKILDGQRLSRQTAPLVGAHIVGEDYFRVLDTRLLAGRAFGPRDRRGAPRVAIVNQAAAHRLWPGRSALGRRLQIGMGDLEGDEQAEVVGVVADVRYGRLDEAAQPAVYQPDAQAAWPMTTVMVRTSGDAARLVAAARAAVRGVDPDLPLYDVRTLEEQVGFALSKARFGSLLLLAFALLALLLAALGVYGVLSQAVTARRREIGLRMALGARARQVERLVLRQGLRLTLGGAAVGLVAAVPLSGLLRGLLYGVGPRDAGTFLAAACLLLLTAVLACVLPARRAARLDPTLVLRQD